MLAAVRLGRSDFIISAETNSELDDVDEASVFSVDAEPPVSSASSNAVPRTVITFTGSLDFTFWMAFPA